MRTQSAAGCELSGPFTVSAGFLRPLFSAYNPAPESPGVTGAPPAARAPAPPSRVSTGKGRHCSNELDAVNRTQTEKLNFYGYNERTSFELILPEDWRNVGTFSEMFEE